MVASNVVRAVYYSYVRPAILHGNKTWCLSEKEMAIFQRTRRSIVKRYVEYRSKIGKVKDLMLMLALNDNIGIMNIF